MRLPAAVAAVLVLAGCSAGPLRDQQSVVLRDTCASIMARATGLAPAAASIAASDASAFRFERGQSSAWRAVDLLVDRCVPRPR